MLFVFIRCVEVQARVSYSSSKYLYDKESERTSELKVERISSPAAAVCSLFAVLCVLDNEFIIFKVQCALVRDSPQTGCTQFSFSVSIKSNPISFSFCVRMNNK